MPMQAWTGMQMQGQTGGAGQQMPAGQGQGGMMGYPMQQGQNGSSSWPPDILLIDRNTQRNPHTEKVNIARSHHGLGFSSLFWLPSFQFFSLPLFLLLNFFFYPMINIERFVASFFWNFMIFLSPFRLHLSPWFSNNIFALLFDIFKLCSTPLMIEIQLAMKSWILIHSQLMR